MHLRGIMAIMRNQLDVQDQPTAIELLILSTEASSRNSRRSRRSASTPLTTSRGDMDIDHGNLPYRPFDSASITSLFNRMVSIFDKVADLFKRTSVALKPESIRFESQLKPLKSEATALRLELLAWASTLPVTARPVASKRFTQPYSLFFLSCRELECPVLHADSYTDCK
jgi:hypothetical protein